MISTFHIGFLYMSAPTCQVCAATQHISGWGRRRATSSRTLKKSVAKKKRMTAECRSCRQVAVGGNRQQITSLPAHTRRCLASKISCPSFGAPRPGTVPYLIQQLANRDASLTQLMPEFRRAAAGSRDLFLWAINDIYY